MKLVRAIFFFIRKPLQHGLFRLSCLFSHLSFMMLLAAVDGKFCGKAPLYWLFYIM